MKLHLPLNLRIALLSVCLPLITPCAEGRQSSPDTIITLVGSYVRDGYSSDDDKQQGFECKDGGALHVNGKLTMLLDRNVVFTSNRAGKSGGAVYATSWDNGFSYIQNLFFGNNKAEGSMNPCSDGRLEGVAGGGGIFGCAYITNCDSVVFSSNKATRGSGGGMLTQRNNLGLTDNDSIIFKNNHAAADGGAIALKTGEIIGTFAATNCILSVKNNKYVDFSHNKAEYGNGGAIDAIGVVCSGNIENGVLFQSNSAAVNGGAIYADYFTCVGNKGTGISFVGNSAEYGGAVYAALSNYPAGAPTGELAYTVYMSGNDCIRFADNVATGKKGGAIYAKGDGYYSRNVYLVDNDKVDFERNKGGAIYSGDDVILQGNEKVRFQGNGTAIEAETIYLSTSGKYSYIYFDDSISASGSVLFNSLPQKYHTSSDAEPLAQGSVIFSGKNSQSYSKWNSTLASGILRIENGASFKIGGWFSHQGGKTIIEQPKESKTVLDVYSSYTFDNGGGGCLTFDLYYNGVYATPLVNVGGNLNLIDKCLTIDASGLDDSSASIALCSSIALLKVGEKINYGGDSYNFENGKWVNSKGNFFDINNILTSTLNNNASLKWENRTLYYKIDGPEEYVVKGLGKESSWRGDVLDWHDVNKDFTIRGLKDDDRYATTDVYYCWVASAANMIQYWQDRYAPLFQSDELVTARTNSQTAGDVYAQLRAALPEYDHSKRKGMSSGGWSSWANVACSWWFNAPSSLLCNGRFNKINSSYSWKDLGFSENNFVTYILDKGAVANTKTGFVTETRLQANSSMDKFCAVLAEAFNSDSAVGLGWKMTEKSTGETKYHAITIWTATRDGDECVIEYTDSDRDNGAISKMILKEEPNVGVRVVSYYDGNDSGIANGTHEMIVYAMHTMTSPKGMDELLDSYYNTKTLYWTGTATGGQWKTSSNMIGNEHHLANLTDGWKKECTGGGKTIFAHAYVTPDKLSQATFVFDESVLDPRRRVVVLNDNLSPASVVVRGSDYAFEGSGALWNTQLNVESGASLGLSGTNLIGCTIELYGSISNDLYGQGGIRDCTIEVSGNGELWFSSLLLTEGSPGQSGGVIVGDGTFTITNGGTELFGNKIENGCVFGAILDFQGKEYNGTIEQLNENAALNRAFLAILTNQGNVVSDVAEDYWWNYLPINYSAVIDGSTNADGQRIVAKSTLTIQAPQGNANILRTIGSHRVSQSETTADISMSEVWGGTVLAEDVELLTMPLEKTILSGETSITAAALTVSVESTLMNDGQIIAPIAVKSDGMLGGSGQFGATTVYDGGRLMVGNSPGAPVYETLTLQSGSTLMFCLDGSTPATESQKGWGSGTHSVLHVTRADGLTVENGSTVQVGCSLEFLNAVPQGDVQTLSLVQLSNAGSDALVGALQGGTVFMLAEADDTFSDLSEVGAVVHHAEWQQGANNTLELSFIVSSMSENALIWSNAAADGKWDNTSANWRDEHNVDTIFADDSSVAFYDAATVEVENTITPGDMVVSTPEDVVWSGSGCIAGNGTLIKEGSGELRIELSNADYTGYVTMRGGALVAAADHALGHAWVDVHGAELDLMNKATNNVVSIYGESTLRGASSLNSLELNSDSHVHVDGGYQVSEDRVLVVSGNNSYTGSLTLAGGTMYFLNAGLTVNGYTTFETGTTTTIDLSDWEGETNGSITLACLGNTNGYTDGCLTLEGIDAECELKFDAATGVLTLVMAGDEPLPGPEPEFAPVLNQNQQVAYDTMKNIMGNGTPGGLLGELGKEVTATRDEAKLKELLDVLSGAEYATLMSSQQDATRGHLRRLRGSMDSGHALAGTRTRAYVEAYTHRSDVDGDSHGRGYVMTEHGGQFALEYLRDEKVSVGLAVAAGRSKLQPDGGLSQKSTNTYLDAFLVHRKGGYTGKTSLGASVHRYDMARNVMGAAVSAEADGSSVNFMHESAYDVALDDSNSVQFFGALESSMGKLDSFHEKGADTASLEVESQDSWETTLSAGARYHYSFAAVEAAPAAMLSLQAGLEYKLGDIDSDVEMKFSGARDYAFRQYGTKRDRFGYNLGASLYVPVSSRAAIYASGDAVLRGDSSEVNANLGVQVAF